MTASFCAEKAKGADAVLPGESRCCVATQGQPAAGRNGSGLRLGQGGEGTYDGAGFAAAAGRGAEGAGLWPRSAGCGADGRP